MLWMFKRVFFGEAGPLVKDEHHPLHDVGVREFVVMVPLVILIFWMGLMPEPFLKYTKASVEHFAANKDAYQLTILESPVETGKLTAAAVADQKEKK